MARETTLRDLVVKADPEWERYSRYVVEYEFTSPTGHGGKHGEITHEDGMRVFRGNYDVRGPYRPQDVPSGGLTWDGEPLIWATDELTWDGD